MPPQGVEHHYAPLAIISVDTSGKADVTLHCRRTFEQIWKHVTAAEAEMVTTRRAAAKGVAKTRN